jgi:hypothetical protein
MPCLPEEICSVLGLEGAHANAYGRKAFFLYGLWKEVQSISALEASHALSLWREVFRLPKDLLWFLHQCAKGGRQELLLQFFQISSDLKFVFLDGDSSSKDEVPSVEKKKKKSPKVKSELDSLFHSDF